MGSVDQDMDLGVHKAKIGDAPQIHKLVNLFAARGEMLPRALSEIYENIRDFFVVRDGSVVVSCASLHIYWADLAEIRGVAVRQDMQGKGLGRDLVEACVAEAKQLDIIQIFCLTDKPGFFEKVAFHLVDKADLPRKVWAECYSCPKFPDCDEVALVRDV